MARTRVRAGDAEIVREAQERFERCRAWEETARANALADAKFAAGDPFNMYQWDAEVRTSRGDRPCLTMNKTRQHNLQIINDARQHKAQIKVTPTGGRATYEAAQIFSGIVRRIEYQSKAIDAYSTAFFHQVDTGYGMLRVTTDYVDDDSTDQDIFIRRVPNPYTVYLDPDAKDYDKADMRFAFVFEDIARERYEAQYGKEDMPPRSPALDNNQGWNDEHHVRKAEYWRRLDEKDTLHLLADGRNVRESDMDDDEIGALQDSGAIVKSRDLVSSYIEWYLIVGDRVRERHIEGQDPWPGRYIPLVPVIGEEIVIEQKLDRKGHTRALIDAQRMYNYWSSAAVEQVALQTKTPYIGDARAIEGYQKYWETANTTNLSILPYNGIDENGQPIERPAREQPPVMAQAYIQGMSIAREDMMMVSGQYQAEMGAPSNERSGVAIEARQRQGDNATYHYIDNQAKAIRQVGRIVLDLIPKIYDTPRVMKIMNEDGSDSDVHLVPNAPAAHAYIGQGQDGQPQQLTSQQYDAAVADPNTPNPRIIFNPDVGRYDVEADVGPPFGTQRQEAANACSQIMAQNPAAFQVVGDFWAQNSDFPGADELADRLRRGLPPQYKAGPDPQVVQISQQAQQMQQQAQALLQKADAEIATLRAQIVHQGELLKDKSDDLAIKDYSAETERLKAVGAIDPNALQMIVRQMVRDMMQTEISPMLQQHVGEEAGLQAQLAQAQTPPPPPGSGNGQAAPQGTA